MTEESWKQLFESQDQRCAVCRTDDPKHKYGWHTDHDHATGGVRGILCHSCNTLLGRLGDNAPALRDRVAVLLDYLERAANPSAVIAA